MPFLRRRGVMASESDMRRHPSFLNPLSGANKQPLLKSESATDLPTPSDAAPSTAATPKVPAPPVTPPNDSPPASHGGRAMSNDEPPSRPESPPIQEETPKHRRFSMLRFRNASDSQLSARAKQQAQAEKPPPIPRPPEIITTAPTMEFVIPPKKQSRMKLSARLRRSGDLPRTDEDATSNFGSLSKKDRRKTMGPGLQSTTNGRPAVTFDEPDRPKSSNVLPPEYGEDGGSTLALPVNRLSESSRSDGSSGDRRVYGSTTTTTHTVHTTTTFFRLPRRKQRQPPPLFPISHLQKGTSSIPGDASASSSSLAGATPDSVRASTSSRASGFGGQETPTQSHPSPGKDGSTTQAPSPARALFQRSNPSTATALFRPSSRNSGHSSPTRAPLNLRGRSSTLSSLGRDSMDDRLAPPATRTSSSTGRKSFGDLLGLSKLRQNAEPFPGRQGSLTPATPGSSTSKNNSLQLPRESIVLPERREDDTPVKYLARLEEVVSRSVIASALSKGTDTFSQAVLRSYMRSFKFFGDPMDMAIRKLLMEAELPRETQQIDRCLQSFANRYHECNPGIYSSPDQAYFIAFSLLILHTDVFNKNNKHKMQKADYLKNTRGEGIFDEILEVFYDNITYTPFIHVEDDFDINGERIVAHKSRKKPSIFPNGTPDIKKATKEPIDPYTLIIDGKLEILRPNLKDVMLLDDPYSYLGTANSLNLKELQKTFFRTGVLQIVSARSRPDAFMSEKTATNPQEAHPGIVDIKITKVGLLWRKDSKKKKTRSPWQEWGAILTGAQLYFFRNTAWVKNLIHQYEMHIKQGHDGIPIIFKPPLEQFKPDALMSTDGAVALLDSTYKKHKHAFTYVRHGGFEEILLADNEDEMNDWLAKLNYAAAFRTSGVRMRGVVGGGYEGQNRRAIRRLDSDSSQSVQTPTGEVTITRSRIDQKMAQDILAARREIMCQKVTDANEKLQQEEKKLDIQLRNARHLQILAPIQPKTREQMLLSAARLAAQLKWTRMEMWRIKCHRDILIMDLEEERQLAGLAPEGNPESAPPEKPSLAREESKASTVVPPRSPKTGPHLSIHRNSAAGVPPDTDSPMSDIFQTPPTSATAASFQQHKHQNSWETAPMGIDHASLRKASVSSAVSSGGRSIAASPPRNVKSSGSAPEKRSVDDHHPDEVDAEERDLLQQTGLLEAIPAKGVLGKAPLPTAPEEGEAAEVREPHTNGTSGEKLDKSKIRRSLQRTLREGAGHLSHHRSRKGKESASSGATDDVIREPDVLARGTGSFVVHGKKASVINFGGDLQSMVPDERLRQRKSQQVTSQSREETASPASGDSVGAAASAAGAGDFRAVLQSHRDRPRRESAASASTATARSFRELHKKYSSAQAARSGSNLTIPSDEESDAAVSVSEGRRTPLPTTLEPDVEEAIEEDSTGENDLNDVDGEDDGDDRESGVGDEDEDEDENENEHADDFRSPPMSAGAQAQFFTPDPPASPISEAAEDEDNDNERVQGGERLPSPPLQAVGA